MIDLYGCGSPNVLKVMLMLEETGLDYRVHWVDVYGGQQHSPEFQRLGPHAKVPVIVDQNVTGDDPAFPVGGAHAIPTHTGAATSTTDGFAVFESGAILVYLAEKTGRFLGSTPLQRSEVLQWLMWQVASVGPMFGQALHFEYIAPAGNEYARQRYLNEVQRLYGVAERRLVQASFLGGHEYSIADVAAWPWIGKYHAYRGIELRLEEFPNLARWIDAIERRPAYQRIHESFKQMFKRGLAAQASATDAQLDRFFGRDQPMSQLAERPNG